MDYEIIDFHTHCFPDELAARAIPELAARAGIRPSADGTVSGLLRSMNEAGITRSVVHSIATKPSQTVRINDWALSVMEQNENITAFGTIHPLFDGWKAEISRIAGLGFKGVKFHPEYQDFYVDDERCFPLYEKIFAEGMMILFHAGEDIGFPGPYHCMPEMLARVLDRFPEGIFIAAHMGGYRRYGEVVEQLAGRDNLYLDTSYCLGEMGCDMALRIISEHGTDRILFATDSPWKSQIELVGQLKALDMSDDDKKAVFSGNAVRLLRLEI